MGTGHFKFGEDTSLPRDTFILGSVPSREFAAEVKAVVACFNDARESSPAFDANEVVEQLRDGLMTEGSFHDLVEQTNPALLLGEDAWQRMVQEEACAEVVEAVRSGAEQMGGLRLSAMQRNGSHVSQVLAEANLAQVALAEFGGYTYLEIQPKQMLVDHDRDLSGIFADPFTGMHERVGADLWQDAQMVLAKVLDALRDGDQTRREAMGVLGISSNVGLSEQLTNALLNRGPNDDLFRNAIGSEPEDVEYLSDVIEMVSRVVDKTGMLPDEVHRVYDYERKLLSGYAMEACMEMGMDVSSPSGPYTSVEIDQNGVIAAAKSQLGWPNSDRPLSALLAEHDKVLSESEPSIERKRDASGPTPGG